MKHDDALDDNGCIRPDVTDLNAILYHIDDAAGRNDALRAYIYALRDLGRAVGLSAYIGKEADPAIDRAQAAIDRTFARLMMAQFELNSWQWLDAYDLLGLRKRST
jgi:hypothetical protein